MKKQGQFACLNNPDTLQQFYEEYTKLTHNLEYSFVSWIINKPAHCAKYDKPYPADEWVLELIMQSYSKILHRKRTQGNIVMESRDKKQDAKMNQAFNKLMANGLRFITAAQLSATIAGIRFEKKSQNINGSQLSDLSIYTATVAVLKNAFQGKDYVLLKTKFDPYHGLRIFP